MLAAEAIFPRVTAENPDSETTGTTTTTYHENLYAQGRTLLIVLDVG